MNYSNLIISDQSNGPGIRVSLFVSGCTHNCSGCFNTAAMKFDAGRPFMISTYAKIIAALDDEFISGFSILGGDPLMEAHYEEVVDLLECIKHVHPLKSIWLWTGWTLDEVKQKFPRVIDFVDVIVDGRYDKTLPAAPYRGSNNQRVWVKTNQENIFIDGENLLDSLR